MDDNHQTHINVFIEEYQEAYKNALAAVETLKEKTDQLIAKVKQEGVVPELPAESLRHPESQPADDAPDQEDKKGSKKK